MDLWAEYLRRRAHGDNRWQSGDWSYDPVGYGKGKDGKGKDGKGKKDKGNHDLSKGKGKGKEDKGKDDLSKGKGKGDDLNKDEGKDELSKDKGNDELSEDKCKDEQCSMALIAPWSPEPLVCERDGCCSSSDDSLLPVPPLPARDCNISIDFQTSRLLQTYLDFQIPQIPLIAQAQISPNLLPIDFQICICV